MRLENALEHIARVNAFPKIASYMWTCAKNYIQFQKTDVNDDKKEK